MFILIKALKSLWCHMLLMCDIYVGVLLLCVISDTRHGTLGTLPSHYSKRGFSVEVKALLKVKPLIVSVFICLHIFAFFGMIFAMCVYNRENRVHLEFLYLF